MRPRRKPVDTRLLRALGEELGRCKLYRKHLCRVHHSTKLVDCEIRVLKRVVFQTLMLKQKGKQ